MLKYLFKAIYNDGTVYEQNAEDRSIIDPEKRSCFYDIDHSKLVAFTLKGDGHEYGVDLRDGHFEIDGIPFVMHEMPLKDFRLVFFRKHTHSFNVKVDDGTHREIDHKIAYRIGWQCTVNGKNYQEIMQIN